MSSTDTPGPTDGPLSGIEVRVPCQYCPPPTMVPRTLYSLHMASEHPDKVHHPDLHQQLAEAGDALYAIGKACLVVKGTLEAPYPDDARWSPWTRFVRLPASTAYNLGMLLRRRYSKTPGGRAHLGTTAVTRLYNAARTLADQTIGHAETCEWHANSHSFCSCQTYGAACAGVDAALTTLADTPDKPTLDSASSPLREHIATTVRGVLDQDIPGDMGDHVADAVLAALLTSSGITTALEGMSGADVRRVTALYERWVKAGPPPLGAPLARWWDKRLAELHKALSTPADQTEE